MREIENMPHSKVKKVEKSKENMQTFQCWRFLTGRTHQLSCTFKKSSGFRLWEDEHMGRTALPTC